MSPGLLIPLFTLLATCFALFHAARSVLWTFAVVAIAAALIVPIYYIVGGDVSVVTPSWIWSNGPEGKDHIIIASVAMTLLLPVLLASAVILIAQAVIANGKRAQRH